MRRKCGSPITSAAQGTRPAHQSINFDMTYCLLSTTQPKGTQQYHYPWHVAMQPALQDQSDTLAACVCRTSPVLGAPKQVPPLNLEAPCGSPQNTRGVGGQGIALVAFQLHDVSAPEAHAHGWLPPACPQPFSLCLHPPAAWRFALNLLVRSSHAKLKQFFFLQATFISAVSAGPHQ